MSTFQGYLEKPPIVFISYSWTTKDHVQKVLELAKRLTADGVDVKIDKWDLKEGQDKYDFMEKMVKDPSISKILIICDKKYAEKANDRKGGVGTETQIITPEIFNNAQQTKFLPIIFERDETGKEYLPIYLRSRIYIDLSSVESFEDEYIHLLRVIFDRPENQRPPIGTPPSHIFEEKSKAITKTFSKVIHFKQLVLEGKSIAIGVFEDYLDNFYSIITTDFKIENTEEGTPFDETVIGNINSFLPYRDEFIDITKHIIRFKLDVSYFQALFKFFTKLLNLYYFPDYGSNSQLYDNYKFITWELFLYLMALLINERRIPEFQVFVENQYFIQNEFTTGLEYYPVLRQYIRSFDEERKKRIKPNAISITVNEFKQRCHKDFVFEDLQQADWVLFLRSKKISGNNEWFPSTLIYSHSKKFEFFVKSENQNEFYLLLQFIKHQDKKDLLETLQNDRMLQNPYFFWAHIELTDLTNFSKLGTS